MTPTLAYRLAGLCAVLGGLLRVANSFTQGLLEGQALEVSYLATDILLLLGLVGIYGVRGKLLGVAGLGGFAISVVGVLVVRSARAEVFGAQTYLVGASLWSVGMAVMGVAMIRRGVGSSVAPWLWIASLLVGLGGTLLPGQRLSFLVAALAFSAGYIAAGLSLVARSGRGEAA